MPNQTQFEAATYSDLLRSFGASVLLREDVQTRDHQTFPKKDDAQYSMKDDQNVNERDEESGNDVE